MAPTISSELVTRLIESGAAIEIINKKKQMIAHRLNSRRIHLKAFLFILLKTVCFCGLTFPKVGPVPILKTQLIKGFNILVRILKQDPFLTSPVM